MAEAMLRDAYGARGSARMARRGALTFSTENKDEELFLMHGKKRIAMGMSGGLDSSVAVHILQTQGYEVLGVTCVFVEDEGTQSQLADAKAACERFGVEHVVRRSTELFERRVIRPFVDAYASGLTPSPCVGCNSDVKIAELLAVADELGCDFVATGHYARLVHNEESGRFAIAVARDATKDQSYMLSCLSQEQLARLVLPLGEMTKAQVREVARGLGMVKLAEKAESQDICFAPCGYRELLARYGVAAAPGPVLLDGLVVGEHTGLVDYTVGQRKGIGVAGPVPYYVIDKNADTNELRIGTAQEARVSGALVRDVVWQQCSSPSQAIEAQVKLRYRSAACPCIIEPAPNDRVLVKLASAQAATAPGQYAVFYLGSTVLGGGVIEEVHR